MNIGELLDKKYKIVGNLGQGGTAQVLLAENTVLNNIWLSKYCLKAVNGFPTRWKKLRYLKA